MKNKSHHNENDTKVKSETIKQLAHRHMLDKNHTTTDEELRNARIEFNECDNSDKSETPDPNKEKEPLPNPYDVLK